MKIDVLTYCSDYTYDVFERFVGSLHDTGFTGNIFIIIKIIDLPIINKLKKKYNNLHEYIDVNNKKNIFINYHRFFVYEQFLSKINLSSDYLLICDSRDVLFQKNIEEYNFSSNIDLYIFEENKKFYEDKIFNTMWIKQIEKIINIKFYNLISDNYIICAGTIIGNLNAIKKYINLMVNILTKYKNKINDQGILNYMIYMNKLEGLQIKSLTNSDNLVNTVGFDVHRINEDNKIVNSNNEVSWIVHQYDRFPIELKTKLSTKYNFII